MRVWGGADDATRSTLTERAVEHYMAFPDRMPDSKGIVFALTLDHAARLMDLFRQAGLHTRVLQGTDNAEARSDILADFARPNEDGGAAAIINVGMIREGFDAPGADILLILRPPLTRRRCISR